ncbi:hypothetical protein PYCCODRAFT_783246 [Trametes coccinea BRFM310]|uniref:Uncharacterized protein n=1 Tax=Trametes coccinea (strain BRFM310) TaxID=1353009 RepID=A0A1Y2J0M0_TRAC3|nr:hypothetical protein PYCCODRAFT_783246 [Trametes coccinea BRFM310]
MRHLGDRKSLPPTTPQPQNTNTSSPSVQTPRRDPNPVVADPGSLVGFYDLISTSLSWGNDPCVSSLHKLSAEQREEMKRAHPALYEFLCGYEAALTIWSAPQQPIAAAPRPESRATTPTPARSGPRSALGDADFEGGQSAGPLWPETTIRGEQARCVPQTAPSNLRGGSGVAPESRYSGLRVLLQRRMPTDPHPRETMQTTDVIITSSPAQPKGPLKYFHRTGAVAYTLVPFTLEDGIVELRPTIGCPIVWDSPLVGLPPPALCFTAQMDASPVVPAPFACLTWMNPREPDASHYRVLMIFKKRQDDYFYVPPTEEERHSLGIGLTGPEVKALCLARAQRTNAPQ